MRGLTKYVTSPQVPLPPMKGFIRLPSFDILECFTSPFIQAAILHFCTHKTAPLVDASQFHSDEYAAQLGKLPLKVMNCLLQVSSETFDPAPYCRWWHLCAYV